MIVSLLDLHPGCGYSSDSVIEILEAGTGHGALTLHLARAVHAANAAGQLSEHDKKSGAATHRAVVHSLDVSQKHSEHATKLLKAFRWGMYMSDVRFHVGDVSAWVDQHMRARGEKSFLTHVLLDLPSSHSHIERVASALQVDGKLVVFNPSITQINKAIELVKNQRLPLQLERVVEVGPTMTGGRVWDIRFVKPRSLTNLPNEKRNVARHGDVEEVAGKGESVDAHEVIHEGSAVLDEGYEMVCRPKAGDRVSGCGFVALWSKNRTREHAQ